MPACKCPHRRREKVNTCKWPDDCIPDSCATAAEQDQTTIAVAGRGHKRMDNAKGRPLPLIDQVALFQSSLHMESLPHSITIWKEYLHANATVRLEEGGAVTPGSKAGVQILVLVPAWVGWPPLLVFQCVAACGWTVLQDQRGDDRR
eukprot:1136979-Pelagomonas_calceolata.AAC.1